VAESKEAVIKCVMKRVKKNCPVAMRYMGNERYEEGNYKEAVQYLTKAAELGDAVAHYNLSIMFCEGEVVQKDMKKSVYHVEEGAIGGHPEARYNLGCEEYHNRRFDRAKKHYIIAANLGDSRSLNCLKDLYAEGHASRDDYAGALRAYQAALDATKSEKREVAEEAIKNGEVSFF
jgi:TPR repeat protein